ncbi:MAG: hypothetical protein N5P05_004450 (plasmid) [Chroococcopsis gigantea SAG 12.99]|jgi:hypothetical protein|nr:hypothetical protein [Chlorogloea purpurea SAG 13.99]MDV3002795.1 hypothetical protein [Chroococcopsis gigantea SAG 12.99]
MKINSSRPLTYDQRTLMKKYGQRQLEMSPQEFLAKWELSYKEIAMICRRSLSAVKKWFSEGENSRQAGEYSRLRLGIADWLLEHAEELSKSFLGDLFKD